MDWCNQKQSKGSFNNYVDKKKGRGPLNVHVDQNLKKNPAILESISYHCNENFISSNIFKTISFKQNPSELNTWMNGSIIFFLNSEIMI